MFLRQIRILLASTILALGPSAGPAPAQPIASALWSDASPTASAPIGARVITPERYRTVAVDRDALGDLLRGVPLEGTPAAINRAVLELPLPAGGFGRFTIVESPILAPELGARYPEIRTYAGYGLDDPSATARLDLTPSGFHALIFSAGGSIFIDPLQRGDLRRYQVYYARDDSTARSLGDDTPLDPDKMAAEIDRLVANGALRSGTQLRTYRAAVAATGEYTSFQGGTVALALAAITTTMNRVTGVFEREVSIRMQLVPNEDLIIYTNSATDPYDTSDKNAMLSQNQSTLDSVIGSANYDVGHVFAAANLGGVAYLGAVCRSWKAGGVSGLLQPIGDAFDIDIAAHEFGHQFGANHSFNSTTGGCGGGNRNASTAYEPGSASSIMSYAGSCGVDNVQEYSDDYFNWMSIQEIVAYSTLGSGNGCAVKTPTGVVEPVVQAPAGGFSIPIGTPFTLTATATTTGTPTWCWEESDLGPAGHPDAPSGNAPLFRSFLPVSNGSRTFPQIGDILDNRHTVGELLPPYARDLSFKVTVRDVQPGGVGVANASVTFSVAAAGPFMITSPDASANWPGGLQQTVTWDVAGTDLPPVNCAHVNILLSTDGGITFPTTLVAGTPNDGAEGVIPPSTPTTLARIRVEAADGIFFDVSDGYFTIAAGSYGACCIATLCEIRLAPRCATLGGIYQGFGTICDPDPCQPSAVEDGRPAATQLQLRIVPNPGTGDVMLRALSPMRTLATMELFDASGRLVRRLHEGVIRAGETSVSWDGRDDTGQELPAGAYLARMRTSGGVATTKIVIAR
jgi:hypothetical protein